MAEKDVQIMPINSNILTGITIDELEDRLEMQLLGLFDVLALSQVTTTDCRSVSVTIPGK